MMEETLVLLPEDFAMDAHISTHGDKAEVFEKAADSLNANSDFSVQIDGKSVRDRYERAQKSFNRRDKEEVAMSSVGGEVKEADELFSKMREAREEQAIQKNQHRQEVQQWERRKMLAGARLVEKKSTIGAVVIDKHDERIEDGGNVSSGSGRETDEGSHRKAKKRRVANHGERFQGEMDRFGAILKT